LDEFDDEEALMLDNRRPGGPGGGGPLEDLDDGDELLMLLLLLDAEDVHDCCLAIGRYPRRPLAVSRAPACFRALAASIEINAVKKGTTKQEVKRSRL